MYNLDILETRNLERPKQHIMLTAWSKAGRPAYNLSLTVYTAIIPAQFKI
jgi:hypothetical protein